VQKRVLCPFIEDELCIEHRVEYEEDSNLVTLHGLILLAILVMGTDAAATITSAFLESLRNH
jgi:hypothetical protein